jgi:hypothetical protein
VVLSIFNGLKWTAQHPDKLVETGIELVKTS